MIQNPLTQEQIDELVDSLPDGACGMGRSWGYNQLVRAVEAKHEIGTLKFEIGERVQIKGPIAGQALVDAAAQDLIFPVTAVSYRRDFVGDRVMSLYKVNGFWYEAGSLRKLP